MSNIIEKLSSNLYLCKCVKDGCNNTFTSRWGSYPLCYSCFLKWEKSCINEDERKKFWKGQYEIKKGECLIDSDED